MMKMKYIVFPLESVIYDGEEILKRIVEHCRKGKILDDVICKLTIIEGKPVKCKDCKYFSQNDRWCERYECDEGCGSICWDLGEDGFCSKAEERIYCKDCKYFKLGKCYWRGDFEEAEKINGVEIIREYPQPTNMNDWCGNGEKR